ncbi:N-acetylmuramoyl-L-alanine amidase [Deinococcus soli (ex Cha et al. 2016)]|uniref:N-acetylmuramoyl-L-alanine amidase n=1 Tax=Deinococcus soli (ex Cha et al. 2016) TaxID=1309411 RepID=UPI001666FBA8|nr:N-acetylmuramoyl-L-alanine amidase [Deinococcus soli (ex Cha et al. 2016)]GGB73065.1 N-acetylmuramoyl-L-alanine amidase [Deinococcus soli (ex Cha et al. 2016)]
MKRTAILLSSGLLFTVATGSLAQNATPFTPGAPGINLPSLAPITTPGAVTPGTVPATPDSAATFGNPRVSSQGSVTRVVFDLPTGLTYALTPTFAGLRLDVQGARVQPAISAKLGASVSEYRAGAGQATLITPYPLAPNDGWRASEATLATGKRVLILELGPGISGGAGSSVRGQVRTSAPTSAAAQTVLNALLPGSLPPGDQVRSSVPLPAPSLPDANPAQPSALQGSVPGPARPAPLGTPRIGKSPGQTRVVLDLPPGSSYRITTGPGGLNITLSGVTAAPQQATGVSPELRGWTCAPTAQGATVTLSTAARTTDRSGWRAQLLPPANGDLSRLVLDLSPALADRTPLTASQRTVQAVAPQFAARPTALLALSTSLVKPRVVLDPGHGGKDPGAVGAVIEKQVTLDVALRVRELLSAAGVDVILTRDSDRELHSVKTTDLQLRAAMGTPGTALFVSIHVNALEAAVALRGYGIETWWNPNHARSSALAALLQTQMVQQTGAFDKGLKNSQSLGVLRNSRVPAALVEIGFASHPVDGQNLQDSNYLDRVALGIAQGIREALVNGVTADGASAEPAPTAAKR